MKKIRAKRSRRKLMQTQAAGGPRKHTLLWLRQNGHCWYCGSSLPLATTTLDHVVAIASGGGQGLENLVAACADCNLAKAQLPLEIYRARCGGGAFYGER